MESNFKETRFDPRKPTKIIIHGYNSNMNISALVEIRKGNKWNKYQISHFKTKRFALVDKVAGQKNPTSYTTKCFSSLHTVMSNYMEPSKYF